MSPKFHVIRYLTAVSLVKWALTPGKSTQTREKMKKGKIRASSKRTVCVPTARKLLRAIISHGTATEHAPETTWLVPSRLSCYLTRMMRERERWWERGKRLPITPRAPLSSRSTEKRDGWERVRERTPDQRSTVVKRLGQVFVLFREIFIHN